MENTAIRDLANIPRYFSDPLLFSTEPKLADFRPGLSTLFALDYKWASGADPFLFQVENFLWLLLEVLCVYLLFRLVPGITHNAAFFGAAVCAVHPVLADVINYALQRGSIVAGTGLCAGLSLWVFWPRKMPAKLPMRLREFPRNTTEEVLRWIHLFSSPVWEKMLTFPIPLYLIPVAGAMLADPVAAVFPLILLVWILLFEGGERLRRVVPSAIVCGAFIVLRVGLLKLTPAAGLTASYLYSKPSICLRSLLRFLAPVNLSATVDTHPLRSPFEPAALAGYAALGLLIALAVFTGKREKWRAVSFGLWWFLIASLATGNPDGATLVPLIGLSLATVSAVLAVVGRLTPLVGGKESMHALAWTAASIAILGFGLETYQRNEVWRSDDTLWLDVATKNPDDGYALLQYGQSLLGQGELKRGMELIARGASRLPNDSHAEVVLAQALSRVNRDQDAERHFKRALELEPSVSANFSVYAQWLSDRQRTDEAVTNARKALAMDGSDLSARHLILDDMSRHFRWQELVAWAKQTLLYAPHDEQSQNMMVIAQLALDKIADAEQRAAAERGVDNFLYLSLLYFQNERYADSVRSARAAIDLNPTLPHGYANIAAAYYAMGKLDDSIGALESVLRINPDMPGAKNLLQTERTEKSKRR